MSGRGQRSRGSAAVEEAPQLPRHAKRRPHSRHTWARSKYKDHAITPPLVMASEVGGLWSSFHSSLAQAVRGPGTPQRQPLTGQKLVETRDEGVVKSVTMSTQFTELDLLLE